ncbi:retrotransposon protein [Striga asiatica]|uniref:Retrotransposon protein n=1 Tax=Striga asiatica TaxID=4170 RepID=A0A5A7NYD5_STRAF|nr:retrotransposon protein [Striga asiatica]
MAASLVDCRSRSVTLMDMTKSSLDQVLEVEEQKDWRSPLIHWLQEPVAGKDIRDDPVGRRALRFYLQNGILYKRSYMGPHLRCVSEQDGEYVLREVHEGCCGDHIKARALVGKVLRAGYFWPTMRTMAQDLVRKSVHEGSVVIRVLVQPARQGLWYLWSRGVLGGAYLNVEVVGQVTGTSVARRLGQRALSRRLEPGDTHGKNFLCHEESSTSPIKGHRFIHFTQHTYTYYLVTLPLSLRKTTTDLSVGVSTPGPPRRVLQVPTIEEAQSSSRGAVERFSLQGIITLLVPLAPLGRSVSLALLGHSAPSISSLHSQASACPLLLSIYEPYQQNGKSTVLKVRDGYGSEVAPEMSPMYPPDRSLTTKMKLESRFLFLGLGFVKCRAAI